MTIYDKICLSSGGVKGIVMLGILQKLIDTSQLKLSNINELAGTSIGSVICVLLSIGFTPLDIYKHLLTWDIKIEKSLKNCGLFSFNDIRKTINDMILDKCGYIPSVHQIYINYKKVLIISVSNISLEVGEYITPFNSKFKDLSVVDAIEMSCSIPFIFPYVVHKGEIYVDGVIYDPCPLKKMVEMSLSTSNVICILNKSVNNNKKDEISIVDMTHSLTNIFINSHIKEIYNFAHELLYENSDMCELTNMKSNIKIYTIQDETHNSYEYNKISKEEKIIMFNNGYAYCG